MDRTFAGSVTTVLSAIALGGLSAVPVASEAGGIAPGVMLVSASVRPSAAFRFEANISNITISAADIERGYIEIAAGSLLSVSAGKVPLVVVVEFAPQEGAIKSVEVRTERGWRVAETGDDSRLTALAYRFNLSDKARPGSYPVPLTLNITL